MPSADFYEGLPLAEKLEKLVDHHHDPKVRHISRDEAQIMYDAVARLKAGVSESGRRSEFEENWLRLEHVYETTLFGADSTTRLTATSVPARGTPVPDHPLELDLPMALVSFEESATPRTAQIALNGLLDFHRSDRQLAMNESWETQSARRSPPANTLGDAANDLINRALYQPTIAVEESPPVFLPLTNALTEAEAAKWIALVMDEIGDPVAIVATGTTLLFLKVAYGAATGLSLGFKERMYQWARPSDQDEGNTKKAKKAKPSDRRKRK